MLYYLRIPPFSYSIASYFVLFRVIHGYSWLFLSLNLPGLPGKVEPEGWSKMKVSFLVSSQSILKRLSRNFATIII